MGWKGHPAGAERVAERTALFAEAKGTGQPSDGLMFVYLVELDGGKTDSPA